MADHRSKSRKRHRGAPGEPVMEPYNEKARPHLKWRVKFKLKGKWHSRKFALKKEARLFLDEKIAEFRNLGVRKANILSESLKREAIEAKELLGELSLLEAARHYLAYIRQTSDGQTIKTLVPLFLNHLRDERGVGARHLKDVSGRLNRFAESFAERHPATISPTEFADWLGNLKVCVKPKATTEREILDEDLSVQSRRHYRAVLRNFFAWCLDNNYCSVMPIRGKPPRIRDVAAPAIWTPSELAKAIILFFDWNPAQTRKKKGKRNGNYPVKAPEKMDILANIVLCAFGGLRQSEFERLHWEHVYLDHDTIDLSEITTKNTPSNRHVAIRPNLRAWLKKHFPRLSGPCRKPNFPNRLAAFRNFLQSQGLQWQPNVLRHSYASYLMGELKDAAYVATQMGHIGQGTLYKHYSKPVYRNQAARYWGLTPDTLNLRIVNVA